MQRVTSSAWIACLTLSALLTGVAGVWAAPSIFDDDWKPPPEPAERVAPTSAPAAPIVPPRAPTPRLVPFTPPSAQVEAPLRSAIPDPPAVAAAEKKIKAAYRSEYNRKGTADKSALARLLLGEAQHKGVDPAMLYALLQQAREQAMVGGDLETAVEAARGTRDAFQLTAQAARDLEQSGLGSAIGSLPPPAPASNAAAHRGAELAMQLAELDLDQGEYAAAAQMARQGSTAAHKTDDAEFIKRVSERAAQLDAIGTEFEQDKDALAGLKLNPADASANLAAGRFYAFYLDQPQVGLPFMAKGLDPVLRSVAAADLAAGGANSGTVDQLSVAEAWIASTRAPPASDPRVKDAMQRRAIFWYDRVADAQQGAGQALTRQKVRDLRARRALPGLSGEYFRGREFAYPLFARTDLTIEFNWAGNPPEFRLQGEDFSARWSGFIKAPRRGRYGLTAVHNDGVRIWLDGQLILDKWGANVGHNKVPVDLTGGLQELKIEYTQRTGGSYMALGWVVPGTTHAVPVPIESLFHAPPPPSPVYAPPARPGPQGVIELTAAAADCHGNIRFKQDNKPPARLDQWTELADSASWDFQAPEGEYDATIVYSCDDKAAGGTYSLLVGNNALSGPVKTTGTWNDYNPAPAGRLRLAAGLQTIRLKCTKLPHDALWRLSAITLTPARAGT